MERRKKIIGEEHNYKTWSAHVIYYLTALVDWIQHVKNWIWLFRFVGKRINSYCRQIQFLLQHKSIPLPVIRSTRNGKFQESEGDFKNLERVFNELNLAVLILYPLHEYSLKIILRHKLPFKLFTMANFRNILIFAKLQNDIRNPNHSHCHNGNSV